MSGNNFDILFYSSLQAMWVFDVNTLQIVEVNNTALKKYGYTKKEFLSKTIMDLRVPEDIPLLVKVLPDIRGTKTRYREFKHIAKNGRIINVEIMSYPFAFKGVNSRLVIAQNIDEKKALLGRLDFAEFKLEQILEETKIGFVQLNYQSMITYWNKAAEKLIGYKREYTAGKNLWQLFPDLRGSDFYNYYEKVNETRKAVEFTEYFWPIQKWFNIDIYPVPDGIIINFNDITAKQKVEEKLREKIIQMSEVSFLNSHYIRKPVASLLGLTNLLDEKVLSNTEISEALVHIKNCALELDDIIRTVNAKVNFDGDPDEPEEEMEEFSIMALLNTVVGQHVNRQSTHCIIQKKKADFIYYGHKKAIATAVNNLLHNAIKFSPNASKVIVDRQVIDKNLVLSVKDFGQGINRPLLNKIFLSFTKKAVARELGTGLLKVAETANSHNGSVWVETVEGEGSTFSMRLPLAGASISKKPGKRNTAIFKNTGIEIEYNAQEHVIIAEWNGFHGLHTVKTGALKILEAIELHKCDKLLNSNLNVLGSWDSAVDWVADEWFPLAASLGLKQIAWVYSNSTFSKLSVDRTIEIAPREVAQKVFTRLDDAKNWLLVQH
ncbi:PAS domain S-box protein [Mucilaginibacter glaciei]|uniref:histidine kinase n=1 Tax=Mucilaginibacter glaciei TaxID=2772109 RepID=A0A926S193_9SPHI|nr:PAS domain S-box protein [Mucilaginibacter glaciei]MBD1393775.1 PAS domain S-box protein [Mucilaginibacter glaciei]